MRVLSIGNSFSQDAHYHLHALAKANGVELDVVNLMIGGCSLERHANNIENNIAEYGYELNGKRVRKEVTVADSLKEGGWDVVTVQQASPLSGIKESYFPYIYTVLDCIKELSPDSEIYFHKTWAYETDSVARAFEKYNNDQRYMYEKINEAVGYMREKTGLPVIPVGDSIAELRKTGEFEYEKTGHSLNRDGSHLSFFYGRYTASATWYCTLTNDRLENSEFVPSVDRVFADKEIIKQINKTVSKVVFG